MKTKLTKILTIVFAASMLLTGCNNSAESNNSIESNNKLTIVTSFYPMYISTLNIVKDIPDVEVINMTAPQTGCLHDYSLSTKDLKTLSSADIFVINGAGMESFLDDVIDEYSDLKIIEASNGISLIEDTDHDVNPHVWVSISKNIEEVSNIAKELSAFDPNHASEYEANADAYIAKLENLRTEMHAALDNVNNKDIITFHEAFPYFAEEFNLNIAGVIEVEPDSEPSAKEVENIISIINEKNIKALFTEPQYSSKIADTIAKETGASIYTLDPIVTGDANEDAYDDYIVKMQENLNTLKEALK
ncbi:MAG: zinc ABC transporter substrate-binding protein [Clostridium sp.]|uniref:metal ABC transporter substrate-binding protein n=1 Tax=Clostridium sp. TaxID=1506 RepID=UPI002673DD95|nr:zinc ABC transporter substrate-binding protein [Clostridium sp.]MCI7030690.1 zinc ABC transporter substrate-binding protein [Clostridium sp.]MDD7683023.1 zinc ABC transporter substrate-binding protein [Clostridium sp.]MDY2581072.1 zinc ABC transporter substrate-binding protein [Clostridium sp.]